MREINPLIREILAKLVPRGDATAKSFDGVLAGHGSESVRGKLNAKHVRQRAEVAECRGRHSRDASLRARKNSRMVLESSPREHGNH